MKGASENLEVTEVEEHAVSKLRTSRRERKMSSS